MRLHTPLIPAIVATLIGTAAHAVPTLTLTADAGDLTVGSTFTVTLRGSDFDATAGGLTIDNVSGGQNLLLTYSAGVLELLSVSIAPTWNFAAANKPGTIDNAAGTLSGLAFGAFPAVTSDDFDVATFQFRALSAGAASLNFSGGQVVGRVANLPGSAITVVMPAAQLAVSPVPEPATWALFATALGLAGAWRVARRNGSAASGDCGAHRRDFLAAVRGA